MKKKIINYLKILIIIFFMINIIIYSKDITINIINIIDTFKRNIFPYLFSFFLISDLLINYGFINKISSLCQNIIYKLFKVNKECSFVIFMSILSGSPSSGKYTKKLLDDKLIDNTLANYLICFTHFVNPLFVLGSVYSLLNNHLITIIILISHYLSNFIIGFIIRNKEPYKSNNSHKIHQELSFIKCLTNSINTNINILINILATIIVFIIITTILNKYIILPTTYKAIISGLIEMTQGIICITTTNIPLILKSSLIAFFISFGGLCIHMQIFNILNNHNIKYSPFLLARICQGCLSFTICFLLIKILA